VNSARDAERDSRLPDAARHAVIEEWKRSLGVLLLHRQMALATQVGRFIVAMSGEHSKSADALDAPAHEPPARTR
jgi:hypothetical protein